MYKHLDNAQLNAAEVDAIDAIFTKTSDDLSIEWFDGFITALIIGPKKFAAEDALNYVATSLNKGTATTDDVAKLGTMMATLWMTRTATLLGDETDTDSIWFPLLREYDEAQHTESAKAWAEGFMLATNVHTDHWKAAAEQVEAIDDCATLLTGLINNEGDEGALVPAVRQQLIDSLPIAIQTMEQYWRPWREYKTIITDTKIGRNETCPCGSGKKYKKCCGAAVH